MNQPVRLFFDECVARPAMLAFVEFVKTSPYVIEARPIIDYQLSGIHDEIWLPQIAQEGFIVITADAGKRGGISKGEKLPRLGVQLGIVHVILTKSIHHMKTFEKARAFVDIVEDLVKLPEEPKGSRFSMRLFSSKNPRPVLTKIEMPLGRPDA